MVFDTLYDQDAAGKALESLMQTRIEELKIKKDLAIQHLSDADVDGLKVLQSGQTRKTWRLATGEEDGPMENEVVFSMHGVLSKVDIIAGASMASKAANFSQRIQLVGLGSPSFERAVANSAVVQGIFCRGFGHSNVAALMSGEEGQGPTLNASSHYFTRIRDAPRAARVPFGNGIDPFNVLSRFAATELVHTEENIVKYYRVIKDVKTGVPAYYEAYPGSFRVGDIVEIRGSLVAFHGKQQSIKTRFHLDSMVLLDNTFSKAAEEAKSQLKAFPTSTVTLRRKKEYTEEDEDVTRTRKRFKALSVGGEAGSSSQDGQGKGVDEASAMVTA
ncbi:hypothetical protein DFH09DRAFT_1348539 [Mycena vulgaris]|nr:hypothetical protein DFH09DRAFT_1348539 [Mycena vulgaris]